MSTHSICFHGENIFSGSNKKNQYFSVEKGILSSAMTLKWPLPSYSVSIAGEKNIQTVLPSTSVNFIIKANFKNQIKTKKILPT